MKACPLFFRRFLLVFFLVLPGIHSYGAQGAGNRAAQNIDRIDTCLLGGLSIFALIGGCTCLNYFVNTFLNPPANTRLPDFEDLVLPCVKAMDEGKYPEAKICFRELSEGLYIGNKAKHTSYAFYVVLYRLGQCEKRQGELREESEAKEGDILECKEKLRSLRAKVNALGGGTLECKETLGVMRAEGESLRANTLECKETLGAMRAEVESLKADMLECQKNLSFWQAEVEARDREVFLPLSKLEQVFLDIAFGVGLPLLACKCFNLSFCCQRAVNGLLVVSLMIGVTHLIYGIGKILIISGSFIYEANLTESVWRAPESSTD